MDFSFLRRHRTRIRTKEDFIFWLIALAVFVISDLTLKKLKPDMPEKSRRAAASLMIIVVAVISMFVLPWE